MRLGKSTAVAMLSLMAVCVMMLSACGGSSSSGPAKLSDDKQILKTAIPASSGDIRRLDPAKITDLYSALVANNVFPPLVALDKKLDLIPWAAQAMPTVSADGKTYTFKIRPNLKWSDGVPIDANVFAYSLNRGLDPCTVAGAASYLYAIKGAADFNGGKCDFTGDKTAPTANPVSSTSLISKSIVVVDAQTLQITLEDSLQWFLPSMVMTTAMAQPKQLIEQYGLKDWPNHLAEKSFGGNLFVVTVWDHKGNVELSRNPNFWGTKPTLSKIQYHVYKDTETSYQDYLTNAVDTTGVPLAHVAEAKTRADFRTKPYLDISYLSPNWKKAPFDDLAARQAFSAALDRETLAKQVEKDTVIPTYHIVPQGMPFYNDQLKGADGTTSLKANPTFASQKITDYASRKCGGVIKNCTPLVIYTSNDPDSQTSGEAMRQMMADALGGYPVTFKYEEFNSLIDDVYSANPPQAWVIGWIVDYLDPQDWLSLQFDPNSTSNTSFVNDPTGTALMKTCDTTADKTARTKACNDAEQEMVTQGAWISIWQTKQFALYRPTVHDYDTASNGIPPLTVVQSAFLSAS